MLVDLFLKGGSSPWSSNFQNVCPIHTDAIRFFLMVPYR